MRLYSFGAPRVGNRALARLHTAMVPRSFRAVFRNDLVSAMPGPPFFSHGGQVRTRLPPTRPGPGRAVEDVASS